MAEHKGKYEYMRFDERRESYKEYLNFIRKKDISLNDFHGTFYMLYWTYVFK